MIRRLNKAARWSPLLAALILLGCSTIKFAYNNVDWVLIHKTNHYLNLTDAQREHAEQLIATRMQVHRREELPIYVATLKEVRVMLADNLTPDELAIIRERIPALYRRTMRDSIPAIVSLLVEADDTQIDHLQSRIEERNSEFASDFMPKSLEVRLDRRVERSVSMFEYFIGDLRPEQAELVRLQRNAMPLTAEDWLAYHQARQQEFLVLLRQRASRQALEGFLVAWWANLAGQAPVLERKMEINTRDWSQMILALDKTLDPPQRQKLLDTLDRYIEALGELIPEKTS